MVNYGEYSDIAGWDGGKTCYLLECSEDKSRRELGPDWAKYLPSGYITEGGSSYPYHCEPTTRIVWLALASSAYFSQTNMPELSAIYGMGFNDPFHQLVEARKLELLGPVGALPARVDFVVNYRLATLVTNWPFLSHTVSDNDLRRAAKDRQNYQDFTTGEYRVLRSTGQRQLKLSSDDNYSFYAHLGKRN